MSIITIRFLIIGPVAGAFGFVLADQLLDAAGVSISTLAHPASMQSLLVSVPYLLLYGLVLAYPFGLAPAGLAALTFSRFRRHRSIAIQLFIAGAAGFTFSGIFALVFFYAADPKKVISLLAWGTAGAFGGVGSALACVRIPMPLSASADMV